MHDIKSLKRKYLLTGNQSMSQLTQSELDNVELFHQESIKFNPDFDIEKHINFDRKELKNFPECSIFGDTLYRDGKLVDAYQVFSKIHELEVVATELPTWSQGIYGMS